MKTIRQAVVAMLMLAMLIVTVPAQAQTITSNTATVNLSYTVATQLSVTATPASVTFPSAGGAAPAITITTNWNLPATGFSGIKVYAYFNGTTALSAGSMIIPTSSISATINSVAAGPCTMTDAGFVGTCDNGVGGDTQNVGITGSNYQNGSMTTTLVLSLAAGSYPVGSYTGVLDVVAIAA